MIRVVIDAVAHAPPGSLGHHDGGPVDLKSHTPETVLTSAEDMRREVSHIFFEALIDVKLSLGHDDTRRRVGRSIH